MAENHDSEDHLPKKEKSADQKAEDQLKKDVSKKAKEGLIWTALFNGLEFILHFAGGVVLARILFPDDFGLWAMASIVIQGGRRIAGFGFSMVLVQLKEVKREHFDTVFIINFLLMGMVTTIIYFCAPLIADTFENERLLPVLLVVAFIFLIEGLGSVPQAVLRRKMKFAHLGFGVNVGKFTNIVVAVTLALMGFGVWALVIGPMCGGLAGAATYYYNSKWLPTFRFRFWALRDCFSFGLWVWILAFLNFLVNKTDFAIIGKFLGDAALGLYERAFSLMSLPRKKIVRLMNGVMFASYSRIQEDEERVVRGLLQVARYLSMIIYPAMITLFFIAPSFIVNVYGEKWRGTVLPLQIMCISGLLDSFAYIFEPLLNAKALVMQQSFRRFAYYGILVGCIIFGLQYGIDGVACGVAVASFFHLGLMMQITISRMPLGFWQFLMSQRAAICYGLIQIAVMLVIQYSLSSYIAVDEWLMIPIVAVLSPAAFLAAHMLIRFDDINEIAGEFSKEIRKFGRKIPVIKNLAFVKGKK